MNVVPSVPRTADVVIIGGGVVGAATAFFASRAGLRPVLVERRPQLCTLTTPAATGAFRLQFDNEEELRLVRRSVDLFLNFAEITDLPQYDLGIRRQGYLWLTTDPATIERQRRLVESQHAWGQTDVELLSGDEARYRFPFLGDTVLQARFRGGDGFLDPKPLTLGLAHAAGCPLLVDCEVVGFGIRGQRLVSVHTSRGVIHTERAVIACGPFSGEVAGLAGIALPIQPVVRYKLVMPHVPDVPPHAPMTIDEDTGAHWRPALHGAYLLWTDPATPPGPPVEDVVPDHRFAFRLLNPASPVSVARIVPFWADVWRRGTAHWLIQGGQYTMTPDHRPLIGETTVEGLYVNTGYSGHGIMAGPAGSELLAQKLTQGASESATNPFRLDREFVPRETDVL